MRGIYCCINSVFYKPGIRYWSLEKVLSWIDTAVNKYNVRHIRFDDELFILSAKRKVRENVNKKIKKSITDVVKTIQTNGIWDGFSQHGYETQPLPINYLSAREVLRFRDNAFVKYHTNPVYLEMLEKKFGIKVKKYTKEMSRLKLERRIL